MLIMVYCKQSVWDEAENVLGGQFEGRDRVAETLARAYCQQGMWDEAEVIIIREQFEGRDKVMETFAAGCCQSGNTEKAATMLLRRLEEHNTQKDRQTLLAVKTVAESFLAEKDFPKAEDWCKKTFREANDILGRQDLLFCQSILLLAEVYEVQGDLVEVAGYQALLPPSFQGKNSLQTKC
jgi:hypothetical protein